MQTIYTLITSGFNGSVTMFAETSSFSTRDLAEKAKEAVIEANESGYFPVLCDIQESQLFETEDEVPILKKK